MTIIAGVSITPESTLWLIIRGESWRGRATRAQSSDRAAAQHGRRGH